MRTEDQVKFPPQSVPLKDGQTVTLRFLGEADAEALGDLYESIPREDMRFYLPHDLTRAAAAKKAGRAGDPCFVCLVAEAPDDVIAGYAWYQWKAGDDKSGFGICIRRGWQSVGLGAALMSRLLEIAVTIGPPVMKLTMQHANTRAVALYRRVGFEVVREGVREKDEQRGFDEEPQYWMERKIR